MMMMMMVMVMVMRVFVMADTTRDYEGLRQTIYSARMAAIDPLDHPLSAQARHPFPDIIDHNAPPSRLEDP